MFRSIKWCYGFLCHADSRNGQEDKVYEHARRLPGHGGHRHASKKIAEFAKKVEEEMTATVERHVAEAAGAAAEAAMTAAMGGALGGAPALGLVEVAEPYLDTAFQDVSASAFGRRGRSPTSEN